MGGFFGDEFVVGKKYNPETKVFEQPTDFNDFMKCAVCREQVKMAECEECNLPSLCTSSVCRATHKDNLHTTVCSKAVAVKSLCLVFAVDVFDDDESDSLRWRWAGTENMARFIPSPRKLLLAMLCSRAFDIPPGHKCKVRMDFGGIRVNVLLSKIIRHTRCTDGKVRSQCKSVNISAMPYCSMSIETVIPFPVGTHEVVLRLGKVVRIATKKKEAKDEISDDETSPVEDKDETSSKDETLPVEANDETSKDETSPVEGVCTLQGPEVKKD